MDFHVRGLHVNFIEAFKGWAMRAVEKSCQKLLRHVCTSSCCVTFESTQRWGLSISRWNHWHFCLLCSSRSVQRLLLVLSIAITIWKTRVPLAANNDGVIWRIAYQMKATPYSNARIIAVIVHPSLSWVIYHLPKFRMKWVICWFGFPNSVEHFNVWHPRI